MMDLIPEGMVVKDSKKSFVGHHVGELGSD
jgi:hypothetical protein